MRAQLEAVDRSAVACLWLPMWCQRRVNVLLLRATVEANRMDEQRERNE